MAERQQPETAKPGMNRKEQHQPVVGTDVPDESKEHHTEIAVEAGRHGLSKKGDTHKKDNER